MENLKRYGPALSKSGFATMQKIDNGGWVKFSDIKELLATAHNKQSTPCYCKNELAYTVQKVVRCGKCGKCWLE